MKSSYYGFEKPVDFIKNYLSECTEKVRLTGIMPRTRALQSSVPQGSILGPPLFVLSTMDTQFLMEKVSIQKTSKANANHCRK